MMQARDWMSGGLGLVLLALGILPLFNIFEFEFIPLGVFKWIVFIAGLFMLQDGIVEITNSNILGWVTLGAAAVVLMVSVFQILNGFGVGPEFFALSWINYTLYSIIFIIEGILLAIATVARNL